MTRYPAVGTDGSGPSPPPSLSHSRTTLQPRRPWLLPRVTATPGEETPCAPTLAPVTTASCALLNRRRPPSTDAGREQVMSKEKSTLNKLQWNFTVLTVYMFSIFRKSGTLPRLHFIENETNRQSSVPNLYVHHSIHESCNG
ncbi:hypothetical protein BRADI_4g08191v3 [Brachypodium distachyon]|uniref:Uncharacterized protein n=1 Tax=Brachypodium distachyon TaxID=15368 RepID=A0A2K2CL80_BRADI|nr:hypothetical protein BRADI_4g08191v3 [Brachypodium distachyon]